MKTLTKIFRSFLNSCHGFREAYRRDQSLRLELLGGVVLALIGALLWPLEPYELLFMVLSFSLIIMAELINTAFERILDRLHPEHHELIGVGKDIASAAVAVAVAFSILVVIIVFIQHTEGFQATPFTPK